jgi:hypothetical protein
MLIASRKRSRNRTTPRSPGLAVRRLPQFMAACASLALVLAVSMIVAGSADTASAAPEECVRGNHGFADIPDDLSGAVVRGPITLGSGAQVTLETGVVNGVNRAWAKATHVQPGDQVWMDASGTGGQTWLQCGPFTKGPSSATTMTTPAQFTTANPSDKFRACGETGTVGDVRCSDWW